MPTPDRPDRRAALALLVLAACGDASGPAGASEDLSTSTAPAGAEASSSSDAASAGPTPTTGGAEGSGGASEGATTGEAAACDAPALAERGFIPRGESRKDVELAACGEDRWYVALPSESSWSIRLTRTGGEGPLRAALVYPDQPQEGLWQSGLTGALVSGEAPAQAILAVPRSGEFAIHVRSDMPEAPATYDLELTCATGCARETTRFPVVLVHGWTGFAAVGPLAYFYGVEAGAAALGYPVHTAILDPYNHTLVRSGQLAAQIDGVLAVQRARKVDLIGHSQGGIDSRAVVGTHGYGDRVAAVVTIGSPHRGTYITDLALGLAPGGVEDALGLLLNFVGAVTAQQQSDAKASFYSLSEQHMNEEFNPNNPDDPRVAYISYTGRTCDALGFLDPSKDCQDLVDPLIGWGYTILELARGDNDGLVTVESAKWGDYRGEMIADHIDEVGQIGGVTDLKFDHAAFYLQLVRDLAEEQH